MVLRKRCVLVKPLPMISAVKVMSFNMLTRIQHQNIPFGRALAPLVIPIAKSMYGIGAMINPGKMVSF